MKFFQHFYNDKYTTKKGWSLELKKKAIKVFSKNLFDYWKFLKDGNVSSIGHVAEHSPLYKETKEIYFYVLHLFFSVENKSTFFLFSGKDDRSIISHIPLEAVLDPLSSIRIGWKKKKNKEISFFNLYPWTLSDSTQANRGK